MAAKRSAWPSAKTVPGLAIARQGRANSCRARRRHRAAEACPELAEGSEAAYARRQHHALDGHGAKDAGIAVRSPLAQRGLKKGGLSKLIEEAVKWRVFDQALAETREKLARAPEQES
jgi:hypothetical protein